MSASRWLKLNSSPWVRSLSVHVNFGIYEINFGKCAFLVYCERYDSLLEV